VPDAIADLIARGERAAFHAAPATGLDPLRTAIAEAASAERDDDAGYAGWLLGVCLAASGRWGDALTVLGPFRSGSAGPVGSLAASTAAAVHRQLGDRPGARALDDEAAATAGDHEAAAFDAALGLALDAIGVGDRAAAQTRLDEAAALVDRRPDWWRQRVRLDWGRTEAALLDAQADAAARWATSALRRAETAGAPRHVAKSSLLLGAALSGRGATRADAVAALARAITLSEPLGLVPVLWSARALTAALLSGSDDEAAAAARRAARTDVERLAENLPEPLRAAFLARPDVASVVAAG
jgi:tetratricopeptide (TPR) repeat protein